MYDTIRLRSPYIDDVLADYITNFCVLRQGVDISTGEMLYKIVTSELEGSYDNRIMLQVRDYDFDSMGQKINSKKYLVIECSVAKMRNGHNVYSDFYSIKDDIFFMINTIEKILNVKLPCWYLWQVLRVDVSQNYVLDSIYDVHDYIMKYNLISYPRRRVHKYSNTAIYFAGSTTTFKIYSKFDEYKKHDRKRIHNMLQYNKDKIFSFEEFTKKVLRFEVEIKKRKLEYDFLKSVCVYMLSDDYLISVFNNEVDKVLKLVKSDYELVNDFVNVRDRLEQLYSSQKSKILFAFWNELVIMGYDEVKSRYAKKTFYRHLKDLRESGISFNNSDIKKVDDKYSDFIPYFDSKYSIMFKKLVI
jgi:II/X family phage/plasmid replication protein